LFEKQRLFTENCAVWESLRDEQWQFLTDVSGQPVGPVVGGQESKMTPIGYPETSSINRHYSLRNNPEERSSHLLRDGSLKSRKTFAVDSWFASAQFGDFPMFLAQQRVGRR
jgi:hypothetical protein